MTLLELKNKADPILANFWSALTQKQDTYFAKHGKYFQLLITPNTSVVDGVDSDFTVRKPSDELHVIDVNFTWATKIPFQIEVHEWLGKDTVGYEAVVTAVVGGNKYQRRRDSANNDSSWFKVTII